MIEEVKDEKKVGPLMVSAKDRYVATLPENPTDDIEFPLEPSCFIFTGKSRSGKSVCMKSILYGFFKRGYFKQVLIFCPTKVNRGWEIFSSKEEYDKYVVDKYDERILMKFIQSIKDHMAKGNPAIPNLIVWDDCQGVLHSESEYFVNFLCTYRHFGCTLMFASQYLNKGISTTLREQVCYGFIFRPQQARAYKALFEAFGGYLYIQDTSNWSEEEKMNKEEMNDTQCFRAFRALLNDAIKEKYRCLLWLADKDDKSQGYGFHIATPAPAFKITVGTKKKHPALASKSVMDILMKYNPEKKKS